MLAVNAFHSLYNTQSLEYIFFALLLIDQSHLAIFLTFVEQLAIIRLGVVLIVHFASCSPSGHLQPYVLYNRYLICYLEQCFRSGHIFRS